MPKYCRVHVYDGPLASRPFNVPRAYIYELALLRAARLFLPCSPVLIADKRCLCRASSCPSSPATLLYGHSPSLRVPASHSRRYLSATPWAITGYWLRARAFPGGHMMIAAYVALKRAAPDGGARPL